MIYKTYQLFPFIDLSWKTTLLQLLVLKNGVNALNVLERCYAPDTHKGPKKSLEWCGILTTSYNHGRLENDGEGYRI